PPGGGKIKCPTCAHVFIVRPPDKEADTSAAPLENASAVPASEPTEKENVRQTLEAASPQAASDTPAPATATRSWKVRSAGFPAFDFHTLESLQNWLLGRDSLNGISLLREGETNWKDITSFP